MTTTKIALSLWLASTAFVMTSPVQARNSVSLYGIADLGVRIDRTSSGTSTALQSGQASGSRWGIRGSESLGARTSATFALEAGFSADTGAGVTSGGGMAFNRISTLGITNEQYGALEVGRQYTSVFRLAGTVDPLNLGMVGNTINSFGLQGGLTVRADNAITYASPNVRGFKADVIYAIGESTSTQTSRSAGNALGGTLSYQNGPVFAGVAYYENKGVKNVSTAPRQERLLMGATYEFAALKLHALYGTNKNDALGLGRIDWRNVAVGVSIPVIQAGKVILQYQNSSDRTRSNTDTRQLSVSFNYLLSKKTDLYASVARINNSANASYGISGAGNTQIGSIDPGSHPSAMQIGMRHRFWRHADKVR